MTALLVLTALLLVVSGVIKLRAGGRAEIGLHPLSLIELVAGVGLMVRVIAGSVTAGQGMGAAVGAVVLIVVSSLHLGRRLAHKRRLRDLTEGRRLESFVKLQAGIQDEPEPG